MSFQIRVFAFITLFLWVSRPFWGQTSSGQSNSEAIEPGSATRGENLFVGLAHFHNGGPACGECHNVAGLSFPTGGTLGPDLTHEYTKLGAAGIDAALETLFFPAMTPIYDTHPLTSQERADLQAFLQKTDVGPDAHNTTPVILLIALLGFVVLVVVMRTVWQDRLKGVRKSLLERAAGQGREMSVRRRDLQTAGIRRSDRGSSGSDSDQGEIR